MDAASILFVLAAVGVNFGWQPAGGASEGYEYIVQIEPELVDVMRSGEPVPIESTVPPEVGPIRKVKIVVGRGDVIRTTDSAIKRTAYFAGQAGWAPGNEAAPPAASNYDRYAQPPSDISTSGSGFAAPPSVVERTRNAVSETGATLRDGFEAGVQAANQQIQGWSEDAGRQLQTTGNELRTASEQTLRGTTNSRVSSPFATTPASPPASGAAANNSRQRGGVAPPPWANSTASNTPEWAADLTAPAPLADPTPPSGVTPLRTENGWTTVGSNVAAPPLLVPQLTTSSASSATPRMAGNAGPDLTSASGRQPMHSLLRDEQPAAQPPAAPANDWADNWGNAAGTQQSTPGRSGTIAPLTSASRDNQLVPVQPLTPSGQNTAQQPQQSGESWADLWGKSDPWSQPPQTTPAANAGDVAAANPTAPPSSGNTVGNLNTLPIATNVVPQASTPGQATREQAPTVPAGTQEPWLPLLIVSLSLAGSIGANLFLGWSYMDARQKYRSLVRKTADKFRRVATAAA